MRWHRTVVYELNRLFLHMTLKEATQQLKKNLSDYYDTRESNNIAALVMESLTGLDRVNRLIKEQESLSREQQQLLGKYQQELLEYRPVQYVLGQAHFGGLDIYVDENVLIPRPETAELVDWLLQSLPPDTDKPISVLDIGSGSGCIALALKHSRPDLNVVGVDVDNGALEVAGRNAEKLNLAIQFKQIDILDADNWPVSQNLDLIVSNPPYIGSDERADMGAHVLDYEPHQALFVRGKDVLIFYRRIADFARLNLKSGGSLFFEINEQFGTEVLEMLKNKKFEAAEIKRDLQGKERMVKCLFKK